MRKIGHKYFEHIRELDLSSCRIREIEHLSGEEFSNLRELNLDNNMLTNIDGLHALWKLQILRMNHNRVRGARSCQSWKRQLSILPKTLTTAIFWIGGSNKFRSLAIGVQPCDGHSQFKNLHKCKNLKVLFLQGNDIARSDGLNESYELRELVLDKNRIKYVDTNAFLGLTNLRELRLEENGLRSLSNFRTSTICSAMSLNRISDITEIDKLSSIPFLMELTLANNPVSRKQLYRANVIRRMPTLKIVDGREIGVDERERVELMFVADSRPPNAVFFADQALDQYGVHNTQGNMSNPRGGSARSQADIC